MSNYSTQKAMTLIEVIVSMVIVFIVSAGAFTSFSLLFQSREKIRNRTVAINLAQKTIEEVRRKALNDFDNIEKVALDQLPEFYSDFTRKVTITQAENSPNFKQVYVDITWTEFGEEFHYRNNYFLSRPPEPLPGNIKGKVTRADNNNPIGGVSVKVTNQENTSLVFTTQTSNNWHKLGQYTFTDANGNFQLKSGQWNLVATGSGYEEYTQNNIEVPRGKEIEVDFAMVPLPEKGHIKGRFIDKDTFNIIKDFPVELLQNGSRKTHKYPDNNGRFDFAIEFTNAELGQEKCFTVATGYNNDSRYNPHLKNRSAHCGDFCDNHGWGKNYNYRGWSSAVIDSSGNVISCLNPWRGSSSTDRICVTSGQTVDLGNIPLKGVPTAILQIKVVDCNENPIKGQVYFWEKRSDGNSQGYLGWIWTDNNGQLARSVPAEQELFPDEEKYYFIVRAKANVTKIGCCNDPSATQEVYSEYKKVGPLYQGDIKEVTLKLACPSNDQCGNLHGRVINAKTLAPISQADIWIDGIWYNKITNANGEYNITCPPEKEDYCRIRAGSKRIIGKKSGYYYTCDSDSTHDASNYWYNQGYVPEANVIAGENNLHTDIRLWPIGKGKIKGRIVDAGTGQPLSGIKVTIDQYRNVGGYKDKSMWTGQDGKFEFNDVLETWPPDDLPEDNYFNHSQRKHTLRIRPPWGSVYQNKDITITLDDGEVLDLGDIGLAKQGGM